MLSGETGCRGDTAGFAIWSFVLGCSAEYALMVVSVDELAIRD